MPEQTVSVSVHVGLRCQLWGIPDRGAPQHPWARQRLLSSPPAAVPLVRGSSLCSAGCQMQENQECHHSDCHLGPCRAQESPWLCTVRNAAVGHDSRDRGTGGNSTGITDQLPWDRPDRQTGRGAGRSPHPLCAHLNTGTFGTGGMGTQQAPLLWQYPTCPGALTEHKGRGSARGSKDEQVDGA